MAKTERLRKALTAIDKDKKKTIRDGRYYTTYKDNVFGGKMNEKHIKQFKKADGGELYGKACAVASSSMLAYNFFHWIDREHTLTLKIDGKDIEFDDVIFERKFHCINGRKCANMDVVLISSKEKTILCIESKFTELFGSSKFEIADAYKKAGNNVANINWKKLIEYCETELCAGDQKWYKSGIKQNISHLVALNNFAAKGDQDSECTYNGYKVYFVNALFEPKEVPYHIDHDLYERYTSALTEFQEQVDNMSVEVKFSGFLTYHDIFDAIIKSNAPEGLTEYLENRYMKHHQITLEYKGFKGSVEYSEADDVFFGKIEGIKGLVNYEADSINELEKAFHDAVDSYLEFIKK